MKENKENPVLITIKGKDQHFAARIPLWKAYVILADLEKHQEEIRKLAEKRAEFQKSLAPKNTK